jgi:excisionase family DNA binding protein
MVVHHETVTAYIGARELGEYLNLSSSSVRRLAREGRLPKAVVVGSRPRWSLKEVQDFLAAQKESGK